MRDWFHRFWGAVTHDAENIWRAVWSGIDSVISFIENVWEFTSHTMVHLFQYLFNVFRWLGQFALAVWHGIDKLWHEVRDHLIPWAVRELKWALHTTIYWSQRILGWAYNRFMELWHHVLSVSRWIEQHLIAPIARDLLGFLRWFGKTAWHLIFDAIHGVEHVFNLLRRDFDDLSHKLGRWFDMEFWHWWKLFTRWGAEFVRFLSSPFDYLARHIETFTSQGAGWFINTVLTAATRESGALEEWLSRWLG